MLLGEPPTETIENRFDADGAAEFVREDINTISFDTLASRIREFVATYRNRRARSVERDIVDRLEKRIHETERRITALHGVAIRLNEAQTVDEVYRETTRAAEDILDLDVCFAFAAENDQFVPKARSTTSTDRELRPIPLDSGVMGKTYRTGTSERAVDMDVHDMAEPVFGEYKSGLSVPIGTFGVFQAVSKQPGAFDAIDLELTELLTAHAASVLQRLEFEDQLRIERDRFGALFENTADCIIEADFVDEEPIIQSVNPAFESVFGYEQSEVEGRSVDEVVVGEEEREEARTLTKQVRHGDVVQAEVRRQTTEGLKDFLLRSVPVEDDRLYGVYTDITEQKDNERTIKQKTDRLDKFASTISHDLRNPLNVAEGRLDIAREKGDNEHLQAVASAHSRIQALIDDLLTLARQGQQAQSIESLSLASVVDRCWVDLDGGKGSLTIQTEQHISANESQLQQLLQNLIGNAIEHSDGAVSVTVGDLDNGFYVEDDGPGIPADRRERVFEVGYTTAAEGTGFGLGIVHRIAEDHDWDVSVTEGTNGGTRVEITGVETAAE
ncbi:MAG: ATP-binding protein [Halodesulfurarchaeum sp.]